MVVVVLVGGVALLECCCDACVCVWVLLSGMHSGGGFACSRLLIVLLCVILYL